MSQLNEQEKTAQIIRDRLTQIGLSYKELATGSLYRISDDQNPERFTFYVTISGAVQGWAMTGNSCFESFVLMETGLERVYQLFGVKNHVTIQ